MRRHVPDLLAAFVAMPAARRAELLPDAPGNATDLLMQQLDFMREELGDHLGQAAHQAAGPLSGSRTFLRGALAWDGQGILCVSSWKFCELVVHRKSPPFGGLYSETFRHSTEKLCSCTGVGVAATVRL